MSVRPYKVLFVCMHNSARSILAEYLLKQKAKGRFEAYSAGAEPLWNVNPLALWVLKEHYGIDAPDARSKSWNEFKEERFDFVITVCSEARQTCPIFTGRPVAAHFGSPDPSAFEGSLSERKWLFVQVASQLSRRLDLFCALPESQLEPLRLEAIGRQCALEVEPQLVH